MRESDIRPQDILAEYLRLTAIDVAAFFPDSAAFVHRACPGCAADHPVAAFSKSGVAYVRCGECFTLYANPSPDPVRLDEFYCDSPSQRYLADTFYPSVSEARRERIFRPRAQRIRDLLAAHGAEHGTIIDVGAGTGMLLDECRSLGVGSRLQAIEPSAGCAAICRGKGFETLPVFAAAAAQDPQWAGSADLVASFEVIEHVPAVEEFLGDLARLTRPGGLILVTGLCGTGFDILALGRHAKAVAPPHHLNFLSRAGVLALLARLGLEATAFLTPGQLDVDIVRNGLLENPDIPVDAFTRYIALGADDGQRAVFQQALADSGLSSHMWILARRPAQA